MIPRQSPVYERSQGIAPTWVDDSRVYLYFTYIALVPPLRGWMFLTRASYRWKRKSITPAWVDVSFAVAASQETIENQPLRGGLILPVKNHRVARQSTTPLRGWIILSFWTKHSKSTGTTPVWVDDSTYQMKTKNCSSYHPYVGG